MCDAVQEDVDFNAALSDAHSGRFGRAHHIAAERSKPRQQDRLRTILRTHQREGVRTGYVCEVERHQRSVGIADAEDRNPDAGLQHGGDDAKRLQDLECARMHDGGAGGVDAFGDLVDREGLKTATPKFGGER